MEILVNFPGGKRVDASFKGFTVKTDQPVKDGGEDSAPAPFEYFLASIATCVGIYILNFCQARDIPADNVRLVQKIERNRDTKRLERLSIEIVVPGDFPEKYRKALIKTAELCAVKKVIQDPPVFEITTRVE